MTLCIAWQVVHNRTLWDYYEAHPEAGQIFNLAMQTVDSMSLAAILADFDWCTCKSLVLLVVFHPSPCCFSFLFAQVDLGSGLSALTAGVVQQCPLMERAVLFDRHGEFSEAFSFDLRCLSTLDCWLSLLSNSSLIHHDPQNARL